MKWNKTAKTSHPYFLIILYENLHHNVLKFDVHHGSHGLLLGAHQSRAKDHAEIRYRHQILLAVCGNPANDTKRVLKEPKSGFTTADLRIVTAVCMHYNS